MIASGIFYHYKNQISASSNPKTTPSKAGSDATVSKTTPNVDTIKITAVPILMYHYIRDYNDPTDTIGSNLSVSPRTFDRQLTFLEENNYQTLTLSQMISDFSGKYKIPKDKKPIILTFDDGYADAYTSAYPILQKHHFTAVFYIITGQIGQTDRMTEKQIVELDKNSMVIGSHTVSHPDLTKNSSNQVLSQLTDSKSKLESILNHPIFDFCYPAGKFNDEVVSLAKSAGYQTATTTAKGTADLSSDPLKMPRIRVQNDTNLEKVLK